MDTLSIKTALIARTYLYRLTQMIFGEQPTEEILDAYFSETTEEALGCFSEAGRDTYSQAISTLRKCRASFEEDRGCFLETAKRDYMHLLVGPEDLKAPPWECVYRTGERVLFQEATLKVREAYRRENMLPSQYPQVPDDHIAIELDFMAKLSVKCQEAFEAQISEEYRRLLEHQQEFLSDHLLVWVAKYALDLEKFAPDSLYACAGALCAAYLRVDLGALEEILELGDYSKDGIS